MVKGGKERSRPGDLRTGSRAWPAAGLLLLILGVGTAVFVWGEPLLEVMEQRERLRSWIEGAGPLAPLVSIGITALQVLLAPVPGHVVALVTGFVFGVVRGTLYSMAGLALGSAAAMAFGRWLGRPAVRFLIGVERMEGLDRLAARHGPVFFFLVFLLPMLPDDIACFAIGISSLSIPLLLVLLLVGRFPGMLVSNWIGARAVDMTILGWALLLTGSLLLGALVILRRERVEAAMLHLASRLSGGGDGKGKDADDG